MPMTEKRAAEIALQILQYEATRKEIRINQFEGRSELNEEANRLGVTVEEITEILKWVVLPIALGTFFKETVVLRFSKQSLSDEEFSRIAFKIVQNSNVDISPRTFNSRINRLSGATGLSDAELREFYTRFVIPHAIDAITRSSESRARR